MAFAELIRSKVREYLKLGGSQNALAKHVGISHSLLISFMRGKKTIGLAAAEKLCKVLGLELREVNS